MSSFIRLFGNSIRERHINVDVVEHVKYDPDLLKHGGLFKCKDAAMSKCELKTIPLSFFTFFRSSDVESTYKTVNRGTNLFAAESTSEIVLYSSILMILIIMCVSWFANFGGISIFSHICRTHQLEWSPSIALITYLIALSLVSVLFMMLTSQFSKYFVTRPIGDHIGTTFSILVVGIVIVELMTTNTQYLGCVQHMDGIIDDVVANADFVIDEKEYVEVFKGTNVYKSWIYQDENAADNTLKNYTVSLVYQRVTEDAKGGLVDVHDEAVNILTAPQGICHETIDSNGNYSLKLPHGGKYARYYMPLSADEWKRKQVRHCSPSGSSDVGLYLKVEGEDKDAIVYMLGCLEQDSTVSGNGSRIYIPLSSDKYPDMLVGCLLPQRGPVKFDPENMIDVMEGLYNDVVSHLVYLPKIYITAAMFLITFTTFRLFSNTSQISLVLVIVIGTICVMAYRTYLLTVGHEVLIMVLYLLITWLIIIVSVDAWRSFLHRVHFYRTQLYKIRVNTFDPSSYMRDRNFAQLSVFEIILQRLKFAVFLMYAMKPELQSYNNIKQITGQFCEGSAVAHKLASSLPSFVRMRLWGRSNNYINQNSGKKSDSVPKEVPTHNMSARAVPLLGKSVTLSMGLIDVKGRLPDVCLFFARKHMDSNVFVDQASTWNKLTSIFEEIDNTLIGHQLYLGTHTASALNTAMTLLYTINGSTAIAKDDHIIAFVIAMAAHETGIHRYDWQSSVKDSLSGQLFVNNIQSHTAIARTLLMLRRPEYNIFEGFDLSHTSQLKRIIYYSIICTSDDAMLSYQNLNLLSIYIKQGIRKDQYGDPIDEYNIYLMLGLAAKFGCLHCWWLNDMSFLYWVTKQRNNWELELMIWNQNNESGEPPQMESQISFFDNHVVPVYHCVMLHKLLCPGNQTIFKSIRNAYRRRKGYIRYLRVSDTGAGDMYVNELNDYRALRNATIDFNEKASCVDIAKQFMNLLNNEAGGENDIITAYLPPEWMVEIERVFDYIYISKHKDRPAPKIHWDPSMRRGRYVELYCPNPQGYTAAKSDEFGIALPTCDFDLIIQATEYEKEQDAKFISLVSVGIIDDMNSYLAGKELCTKTRDMGVLTYDIKTDGYTDAYLEHIYKIARERMDLITKTTPLQKTQYMKNVSKVTLEQYVIDGTIDVHEFFRRYCRRLRHEYRKNKRFRQRLETPAHFGYLSDSDEDVVGDLKVER